jgi:threonine dehydratase
VQPSPLIRSIPLSEITGSSVYLKIESLHPPGSFKIRGAANKILSLSEDARATGVVTSSAGNHGAAVAYVAGVLGIHATVCVPETVDAVKLEAIRGFGAEAIARGANFEEALAVSHRVEEERGLTYVHAYDDPLVIAGQGTIALEILDELPEADSVVMGLGGGGLAAGIALALKSARPEARAIGVSVQGSSCLEESILSGHLITNYPFVPSRATVLAGGLGDENHYTLPICQRYLDEFVRVGEGDIADAMVFALRQERLLVEGGGAVGIGAALNGSLKDAGETIVIVISGGGVDPLEVLSLFER